MQRIRNLKKTQSWYKEGADDGLINVLIYKDTALEWCYSPNFSVSSTNHTFASCCCNKSRDNIDAYQVMRLFD